MPFLALQEPVGVWMILSRRDAHETYAFIIGRSRVSGPFENEEANRKRIVVLWIADEISQALFPELRNGESLPCREFTPQGLWKYGVEIIAESTVENIFARSPMRFALDHQTHGSINNREVHRPPYIGS
jgi:hypothetical protein